MVEDKVGQPAGERPSPDNIAAGYELEQIVSNAKGNVPKSWSEIASEVMWRKRTLMAAAKELRIRGIPDDFRLATVDVFVEKAQKQLSERAEDYLKWGVITAIAALAMMIGGVVLLSFHPVREFVSSSNTENWRQVVIGLFRATTVGGFYVGAIIYLVFLSRALLHEMVVLYQRRHALRFGRLMIYLHPDKITVPELLVAFNWNAEYRSAFKDIRADKLVQGPAAILNSTAELVREVADAVKQTKPTNP